MAAKTLSNLGTPRISLAAEFRADWNGRWSKRKWSAAYFWSDIRHNKKILVGRSKRLWRNVWCNQIIKCMLVLGTLKLYSKTGASFEGGCGAVAPPPPEEKEKRKKKAKKKNEKKRQERKKKRREQWITSNYYIWSDVFYNFSMIRWHWENKLLPQEKSWNDATAVKVSVANRQPMKLVKHLRNMFRSLIWWIYNCAGKGKASTE